MNIDAYTYSTPKAAWDTIINPWTRDFSSTATQVGGFGGATATNNGNGTVTYTIFNVSGTYSFFCHAVPNRQGTTGPMRSINQTFQWTELILDDSNFQQHLARINSLTNSLNQGLEEMQPIYELLKRTLEEKKSPARRHQWQQQIKK